MPQTVPRTRADRRDSPFRENRREVPLRDESLTRLELRQLLIAARNARGLTQAELAERFGRRHNFVHAYETGRRIEVVEFLQIAEALGLDPKAVLDELGTP